MNPKSGKAGKAIAPAKPTVALEADDADPGEVAELKSQQMQRKEGKYGSEKVKPHKEEQEDLHWIEIELVGEDDEPIPGEYYKITLPDGSVASGTLDDKGLARVEGIRDAGDCKITFPDLDSEAWESA